MIRYRIAEITGGLNEAVAFLNNQRPSLDVLAINPGWLRTTIVYREFVSDPPDFYPNGVLYPNGVPHP